MSTGTGITVVQGSPQTIWVPVKAATTIYVGGIVATGQNSLDEGVVMLPDASGCDDVTNHNIPFGVVIGHNLKKDSPNYNTTYKCEYITSPAAADPHDGSANEYTGVEGPWSKGDQVAMVKVAVITPDTVLRAPLYATTAGTGPSVLTCTAGNTDGLQMTSNACDFTPVANLNTIYCRTGANAGCYRIVDTTSTTTPTWDNAMPVDTAIGDTFVTVPLRPYGHSTIQFDSTTASWIEVDDAPVGNGAARRPINVLRLDLRTAGEEYVEFTFDYGQFGAYITSS